MLRLLRPLALAVPALVGCPQPCNDIGCEGSFAIEVVADPQLTGELAFELVVDTIPVSCVVQIPINENNVMEKCSDPTLVTLTSERGGQSRFFVSVNREVSEVRVSVARDQTELGTVTYAPVFHDAGDSDACEPCREAAPGKLIITAEDELVRG